MNWRNNIDYVEDRKLSRAQRRAMRRRGNLEKRADKKRKKTERIERKVREKDRLIEQLNGRNLGQGVTDSNGNVFATNQQIEALQNRIGALEKELARTKVEMESVQEDIEELEQNSAYDAEEEAVASKDMEEVMSKVGDGVLTGVNGFLSVVNAGDKPQHRAALAASEALQTTLTTDLLSEGQRTLGKAGVALLKALSYYDREKGLISLMGPDSPAGMDPTSTIVSASSDLSRVATALEGIQSALQDSSAGDAIDLVAMSMGDLTTAIRGGDTQHRDALVPVVRDLNAKVSNLTDKLPT